MNDAIKKLKSEICKYKKKLKKQRKIIDNLHARDFEDYEHYKDCEAAEEYYVGHIEGIIDGLKLAIKTLGESK